jgi:hypothetical protein
MLGLRFSTLRDRSRWYWILAFIAIIAGMMLTYYLEENYIWIKTRYVAYRPFEKISNKKPKYTVLVLARDPEYWVGPLARRIPIHRDYLAKVVKALDACEPSVIALDFDLSSPTLNGSQIDNPEYSTETQALITAILDVSKRRPIVLPAGISHTSLEDPFVIESAVYGNLPFSRTLQRGYINLPFDIRQIPTPQPVVTGGLLDSFSTAIVRAHHENVLDIASQSDVLPFGTFIKEDFPTLTTTEVLNGNCGSIPSKIVIVGASWHRSAFNAGELVDLHATPRGQLSGAVIHANYAEALIDERTHKPLPKAVGWAIEFLISAAFALLLAVKTYKGFQKPPIVALSCILLFAISYLAWQNAGYYFDFFFPATFLLFHAFAHYFQELLQHNNQKVEA